MALKMGLIGSGIKQSRMPRLQEYLGKLAGIEISYGIIDGAERKDFDPVEQVKMAVLENYTGLNITHPYKSRVVELVNRPCIPDHAGIGSYNTLKFEQGEILGANTDYSGFIRAYKNFRSTELPGSICLVGAGGVGKAIAFALAKLGCRSIAIHDRVATQADALAKVLSRQGLDARSVDKKTLESAITSSDGLVNCTETGMFNHPGSAIDLALVGQQQWAFDAIYTPMETEFMVRCREEGMQCMTGFELWINQGLDAFRIFTGVEIEADVNLLKTTQDWLKPIENK